MGMKLLNRQLTILQVEDTASDVELTAYALKRSGIPHSVHVVTDGEQAMRFLTRGAGFKEAPRPDLVLLHLNLPILDGHEVPRLIKQDAALKSIPVIIFSTSEAVEAQRLAYELQANSYVVKPMDFASLMTAVQSIEAYWSKTTALPRLPAESRRTVNQRAV